MSARIVGLGVLASAAALAAIGILGPRPTFRDARPVPDGPASSPAVVETPPLSDEPVARALALAERASGLVIDVDGRPVPGARILARLPDGTASTTNTDAKGRFAVAVPPTDGVVGVLVEATTPDGRRGASLGFRRGEPADLPVVVGRRRTVRVRVVTSDGRAVADAPVRWAVFGPGWRSEFAPAAVATDRDGEAALDVLHVPGSECAAWSDVPTLGSAMAFDPDRGRATTDVLLRLEGVPDLSSTPPPAVDVDVAGTILEGGHPLVGVTVTAVGPSRLPDVVTGAQGEFRLRGLGVPPPSIVVHRGHGVLTWVSIESETRIDLVPLAKLAGRVVDDRGHPLPGVTVTDTLLSTVTAADGTFALWTGSPYTALFFRAPGRRGTSRRFPPAVPPVDVVLRRGGHVQGYVVGSDGVGLDGVRWRVEGQPADPALVSRYRGNFGATLTGGPWTLTFEADGYTPVTVRDVEPDSVVPTVVLRRSTAK